MTLFTPVVWPLATLILALIFRTDVSVALGRVGRVKYRDLELTFREDLRQAERLAHSLPPPAEKGPVTLEADPDGPLALVGRMIVTPSMPEAPAARTDSPADLLAKQRPREAIEAAWVILGRASKLKRPSGPPDPSLGVLIGLLRTLKDRAARADQPPPSLEDARRFVDLAMGVVSRIEASG